MKVLDGSGLASQGFRYRATSLIIKRTIIGPYSRPIPRALQVSWGGRRPDSPLKDSGTMPVTIQKYHKDFYLKGKAVMWP